MKKVNLLGLLALLLMLLTPCSSMADTLYQTSGSGKGGQAYSFWVVSQGNATLKLKQTKGEARGWYALAGEGGMDSWAGAFGWDSEYGYYNICVSGSTWSSTYRWGGTGSYTLDFPSAGTYRVDVRPYTNKEMESVFGEGWMYWEVAPTWKVNQTKNCRTESYIQRAIKVYGVDSGTGAVISTQRRLFTTGIDLTLSAESVTGYTLTSRNHVALPLDCAGMPVSDSYTFYYKQDPTEFTLRVEGRDYDTDRVLWAESKTVGIGTTTLTGRTVDGYSFRGAQEQSVFVSSSGRMDPGSTITFYYRKNASSGQSATSSGSAAQYCSSDFYTGGYVHFGRFEQDGNYGNGAEDILWRVLERDGDRALLLSVYGLASLSYHLNPGDEFVPWSDCTLRVWLSNTFLWNAFTYDERAAILTTTVSTPWMEGYAAWPGSPTQDQVFILSYQEVVRYLDDWSAWPTQHASNSGALVNANKGGTTYWWLRSPNETGKVSIINSSGHLWPSRMEDRDGTVRPAIWVNLNSPIFD